MVYGSDSFSWLHWVGFFYHILVYTVVIWFLNKQASTGQKVTSAGLCETASDVMYISMFTQFAACFTGWGNCVLLIIPGYGLYLGGGYLYSWVSTPEDEPEEVTPEEAAKLEKKDRQKARQERLYGNRR